MGCDGFSHPTCSIQYVIRIKKSKFRRKVICSNSLCCDQSTPLSQNSKRFKTYFIRAKDTSLKPKDKRLKGVVIV